MAETEEARRQLEGPGPEPEDLEEEGRCPEHGHVCVHGCEMECFLADCTEREVAEALHAAAMARVDRAFFELGQAVHAAKAAIARVEGAGRKAEEVLQEERAR